MEEIKDSKNENEKIRQVDIRENAIEWYCGNDTVTVTVHQKKFKTRLLEYARRYPKDVKIIANNPDGSVLAHIPLRYIRIKRPRELTPEQKEAAIKRLRLRSSD